MISTYPPLFAYGTLADPDIQRALFETEFPRVTARLDGWRIVAGDDGYFHLESFADGSVDGVLLPLTPRQMWRADQFEEIPLYLRTRLKIRNSDGQPTEAWVYLRPNVVGEPVIGNQLSKLPKNELLAIVADFRAQVNDSDVPECDSYILVPCSVDVAGLARSLMNADPRVEHYLEKMAEVVKEEYSTNLTDDVRRGSLGATELVVTFGAGDKKRTHAQRVEIFITWDEPTHLAVVTVALPATALSVLPMLDELSRQCLTVRPLVHDRQAANSSTLAQPLEQWLERRGVKATGMARAAIFSTREPNPDALRALLAAEHDPRGWINSTMLDLAATKNLAQYSTAAIYASGICLVEIPENVKETYEERLSAQVLTLFIVELILLQDAALAQANQRIAAQFRNQQDDEMRDGLLALESYQHELGLTMKFWDIRNFKFRTAQALADGIALAFGIERSAAANARNRSAFEQLIQVHSLRLRNNESRTFNILVVTLTLLLAFPIVHSGITALISGHVSRLDVLAAALTVAVFACLLLAWYSYFARSWKKGKRSPKRRNEVRP